MMGLADMAYGVALIVAIALFGASAFTLAVGQGGYTDDGSTYPIINKSAEFQNKSEDFKNALMESVESSQQTDPSLPLVNEAYSAGSAIIKSMLYVGESLSMLFFMIYAAFETLGGSFGVPGWALALVLTLLGLGFVFALTSAILKVNTL